MCAGLVEVSGSRVQVAQGFVIFDREWWHFEYGTRRWPAITGQPAHYGSGVAPEG